MGPAVATEAMHARPSRCSDGGSRDTLTAVSKYCLAYSSFQLSSREKEIERERVRERESERESEREM
jgi:hypothetical protein